MTSPVELNWRSSWRDVASLTITKPSGDGPDEVSVSCELSAEQLIDLATHALKIAQTMREDGSYKFASTERSTVKRA